MRRNETEIKQRRKPVTRVKAKGKGNSNVKISNVMILLIYGQKHPHGQLEEELYSTRQQHVNRTIGSNRNRS